MDGIEFAKTMILTVPSPKIAGEENIPHNFYFHVPAEYSIDFGESIYSSNQILGIGEVGSHGGEPLAKISWSKFFMKDEYVISRRNFFPPWVKRPPTIFVPDEDPNSGNAYREAKIKFRGADESITFLRNMKKDGQIGLLKIIDENTDTIDFESLVQLRSFSFSEPDSEPDIRNYSVGFVEYRKIELRRARGGNLNVITPKTDRFGRYTGKYFIVPEAMGIRRVLMIAYKKKGRKYMQRLIVANGGIKHLKKLGVYHNNKLKNGPWVIPRHTKLYIPPAKGAIFPVR